MIRNLFKHDPPDINNDQDGEFFTPDEKQIEKLLKRKPLKINLGCAWFRKSKERRIEEIAADRLSKEMDCVTFMKKQMMQDAAFKILFSPIERFLIGNQTKPFILNHSEMDEDSDRLDDHIVFNEQEIRQCKFYQQLLRGTQTKKK